MLRRFRLAATMLTIAAGSVAPAAHAAADDDPAPCPQDAACLYENPDYTGGVTVLRFDRLPSQCTSLPQAVRSGVNNTPYFLSLYDAPACSGSSRVALLPAHSSKAFSAPMRAYL
ncbi:peptidase inhibitor family I36 protein [Actinomadura opuntiae]|uniref:peptidase inhibitor family I36 protein n=1 Tax=Actinomadura sp. OS1-43 TaxID=604315 RepID=UPI00255AEACF|nr:peptidase inhibitor family I36 protein [Actinomadura sp. OS1-43]MDL4813865.1 peptidase inhibitor family I36 protein [Actinomadura sp. OS1-43]